jgi:predicted neutral ceramidase superfamily lipid hydrolase
MYSISDENIDYILHDLKIRGIETESLRLNLLDHICILIEENLEENGDFEKFYAFTIRAFYDHELREIEEEILLSSSYKNKRIMKKAMILSGAFSAAGFIGGSLSKIMLFRITDFLLFLGFVSFVLLFLPLVFIVLLKELKSKSDLIIYSSGTLSLMLYFFCMLMKCLGLPSSNLQLGPNTWLILWLAGLGIGSFVFVPSYFLAGMSKPETKTSTIITSILLVAFIGVQFRLTNLGPIRQAKQNTATRTHTFAEKTYHQASFHAE